MNMHAKMQEMIEEAGKLRNDLTRAKGAMGKLHVRVNALEEHMDLLPGFDPVIKIDGEQVLLDSMED